MSLADMSRFSAQSQCAKARAQKSTLHRRPIKAARLRILCDCHDASCRRVTSRADLPYLKYAGATELEDKLASLMRAAQMGNAAAYRQLLLTLADMLRRWVRQQLARQGYEIAEAEDIVQETLLAIHLKRASWDPDRAILPWLRAVTRHKLIDNLRRRGRRIMLPVDDIVETLAAPEPEDTISTEALDRHLATLPLGQSQVIRAISIDGLSPSEAAQKLSLSEGAVRVALHRGLASLSRAAQKNEP